ncbi:nitric oxide reductase transcriptional regulator NorR [Vibrio zhugei]|uniref:Nitric oxide reductase transcriptional regulator NorR n=1 Tax=Vibrio zhugei TaxID=2479546 RepID=A0ABV7CBA4_9VIBR|nr:nitric oxide reductase transcriptional regulator NorR [Vibrio zhugei]
MLEIFNAQLLNQDRLLTERLQQLVTDIQESLACSAVGVLQLDGEQLKPLALTGVVSTTMGRRFTIQEHPRLARILASRELVHFTEQCVLPDPYDGLLDTYQGRPLPVHDCMGISLWLNDALWGVLTLDSLERGHFTEAQRALIPAVARYCEAIIKVGELEREVQALRRYQGKVIPEKLTTESAPELIGDDDCIRTLLKELDIVADSELSVLLTGETGVGKELFAHRLHRHSPRANQRLVHVNCAAIPDNLVESELFGHKKGAFSGALLDRAGRIEAAHGSTLFLDEIGELPLLAQAKLLRVLQNGEIQRVGADQIKKVDVRVVAATNRDLQAMVKSGDFRADLYHRLSVYPVDIPPLRQRGNDILLLAGYFIELNRSRFGFRSLRISPDAEQMLLHYRWPGNIRELEHVISRAALRTVSEGADKRTIVTITPLHLDNELRAPSGLMAIDDMPLREPSSAGDMLPLKAATDRFQATHIRRALGYTQDNWAQAAKLLGIDASNLHKLAKRLALKSSR